MIGSYQVLPLRSRVGLSAMAINVYSAFPKAPVLLKPHHQIVLCHNQDTRWGSLTPLQRYSRSILEPHPSGPSCSWDLETLEYTFIVITSRSTRFQSGSTCLDPNYGSKRILYNFSHSIWPCVKILLRNICTKKSKNEQTMNVIPLPLGMK